MHPLHHCLQAICFQAACFSVLSAESLPTKDISGLTVLRTKCLHIIQGCGHAVSEKMRNAVSQLRSESSQEKSIYCSIAVNVTKTLYHL